MSTDTALPELTPTTALSVETVQSVHHWNEHLFSFSVSRPDSFRFRSGEFVMIGLQGDNGKPLPFGTLMFQPDQGQAAVGDIQADGSFKLSSYGPNDGAVPGTHKVSVSCYEGHRPGKASGDSLGKLLIPLKYTRFGSSGLTAEIKDVSGDQAQEVVLELSGPAVTFN